MTNPLLNQRILCTFPGRAGDLLWALPTVRAIAEQAEHPVDLQIAGEFAPMLDLLRQQPYLAHVCANPHWSLTPPDDWRAPDPVGTPERSYDRVYHLGYRGWPQLPLPCETYAVAVSYFAENPPVLPSLDLHRPWITVAGAAIPCDIAAGFTEAWFELKMGLCLSLDHLITNYWILQLTQFGTRWTLEVPPASIRVKACGWVEAAQIIRNSDVFLGDCSALHVLAVALGKQAVVVEPMPERLNGIFWPLGMVGPQVWCVMGNDGKPSFDARHTADLLKEVLGGR